MTHASALLTIDEAQTLFGATAIALAELAPCGPDRLVRLLSGRGRLSGLPPAARVAAVAHREAHRQVVAAGYGWIVEGQVEGAVSFALTTQCPGGTKTLAA